MTDVCDGLVSGNSMTWNGVTFLKGAETLIRSEQTTVAPDNAKIAFFCEAVRLWREHEAQMKSRPSINIEALGVKEPEPPRPEDGCGSIKDGRVELPPVPMTDPDTGFIDDADDSISLIVEGEKVWSINIDALAKKCLDIAQQWFEMDYSRSKAEKRLSDVIREALAPESSGQEGE